MHLPTSDSAYLLHIGFYKAASTWLQKRYFLPDNGYEQILNPFTLQTELLATPAEQFDANSARAAMSAQATPIRAKGLVPVISSEALSGDLLRGGQRQSHNAERLHAITEGNARVLLVVREQRQLIRSAYKTLVYFGESRSLSALLKPLAADESPRFHPGFLYYDVLVETYRSLFPADSILVLPYEWFRENPVAFLQRVRRHMGLSEAPEAALQSLPLKERVNAGETLGIIEIQRWINVLLGYSRNDYQGWFQRNTLQRVLERIQWHKRNSRRLPWESALERRFVTRVNSATEGLFRESNQRLSEQCGIDLTRYGYQ